MTRENANLARLLSRVVHETMDALVQQSVKNGLLRRALRAGGLERMPATPREVRRFAYGPLRATIAQSLGVDVANAVAEEITRVVDAADARWEVEAPTEQPESRPRYKIPRPNSKPPSPSDRPPPPIARENQFSEPPTVPYPWSIPPREKPTLTTGTPSKHLSPAPGHPRPTTPTEPAPGHSYIRHPNGAAAAEAAVSAREYFQSVVRASTGGAATTEREAPSAAPRVLAATLDTTLLKALSGWLEDRAELLIVRSVFAVLHHIDEAAGVPLYLVLDGQRPGIRPAALAAVAEELEPLRVVLCRSTPRLDRALRTISPATGGWLRLDENHRIDEIAARCLELVS